MQISHTDSDNNIRGHRVEETSADCSNVEETSLGCFSPMCPGRSGEPEGSLWDAALCWLRPPRALHQGNLRAGQRWHPGPQSLVQWVPQTHLIKAKRGTERKQPPRCVQVNLGKKLWLQLSPGLLMLMTLGKSQCQSFNKFLLQSRYRQRMWRAS